MYLIDSSVWVALFLSFDANHAKAQNLITALSGGIYVSYGVISEVLTVLTYKHSKSQANSFIDYITDNADIILINDDFLEEVRFFKNLDKKISFIDASLIYLSKKLNLTIVTLDKELGRIVKEN